MRTSAKIIFFAFLQFVLSSIYIHSLNAQLVSDFRVNDDTTNTEQFSAKIGVDSLGIVTAVWRDQRNNRPNIYCQRFNSNGAFSGQNFRININPDSSGSSAVAVSKDGTFGVCWVEINGTINNSSKVKFRLYNSLALPLTGEIIVNDTNGNFSGPLSVGVNNENEFTIVWEQKNILFQKIDSIGNKIGINSKVNDDTGNYQHKNPVVSVRRDGSFIITWQDSRPPSTENSEDIYMQIFSKKGIPVGGNSKVSDDTILYNKQSNPKISSDTSGKFCISFSNFNLNEVQTDVECQLYNQDGSRFGNNFKIAGSIIDEYNSAIFKKENGDMVSGFIYDNGFRYVSYFQRINSSGILNGGPYIVSGQKPFINKYYSDIAVWNDRIISVWSDERNSNLDVYSNIRSFTNPDTTVSIQNISLETPSEFKLYQNYPNPFNPVTHLEFGISKLGFVSLKLYDFLGKEVKTLVNEIRPAGIYKVQFDGGDLPSGVYFYKIESGDFIQVKSMILIK